MRRRLRTLVVGALLAMGVTSPLLAYDIVDYFPLAAHSSWTLVDVTNPTPGDNDGFTWNVLGEGPQTVGSYSVWKIQTDAVEDTDAREMDEDFWNYYDSGTKLGLYGLRKVGAINYVVTPQNIILSAPLKIGQAGMTVAGPSLTSSATAPVTTVYGTFTLTFNATVNLTAHLDSLETTLGTFNDVIVLTVSVNASVPFVGSVPFINNRFWLARGVGLIRQNQIADPDDANYQDLASGTLGGEPIEPTGTVTHTVTFQPGAHGTLAGGTPAVTVTVNDGDPAPAAPAVTPATGWVFTGWSPALPGTITANVTTTAQYAVATYTVTFQPGAHGTLAGGTPAVTVTVNHGDPAPAAPAVTPAAGWVFTGWSPALPGTITANVTTTAQYADSATPGAPSVTGVTPTRSTTPTWSWVSGGGGNGTFRHQLDGAAGTWTETTATSFTPAAALPDGTHALYVQERNTVGNWSASGVFSIVVDTVPPTVTGLADDDTPTRSKTWTWGATKEIVTYRHGIDTNPVGVPSGDYGAVTSATQATGDGTYYLHVQAKDDAGNESGVVTVHAVLDNTAPAAPAVTGSSLVHTATPTWTWTGGGGGNGTFRCQIDGTAGAWTQTTALSFTAAAALSDGLHALYVEERDTAGNWSAAGSFATEVDAYCFVRYSAEGGGTLTGNADQVVPYGGSTTAVTVTATAGHAFWGWNDGSMDNPRSDTNVTTDRLIVATFIDIVPPAGEFQAAVEQDAVDAGQGWWDFTGHYATTVQDLALELDLVHDTAGRLNGTGTCGLDKDGAIPVLIRGNVCGRAGSVVATLMLRNAEPAAGTTVMLSMVLTLDADSASLVGPVNGSVTVSDAKYAVDTTATLSLPEGMDGTWTLSFSLSQVADDVMGTAVLLLSNATEYSFEVRGMATDQAAVLALAGDPADPAARGIRIRTTITPLEGGQATLDVFSGTGYGQALAW